MTNVLNRSVKCEDFFDNAREPKYLYFISDDDRFIDHESPLYTSRNRHVSNGRKEECCALSRLAWPRVRGCCRNKSYSTISACSRIKSSRKSLRDVLLLKLPRPTPLNSISLKLETSASESDWSPESLRQTATSCQFLLSWLRFLFMPVEKMKAAVVYCTTAIIAFFFGNAELATRYCPHFSLSAARYPARYA